ncbi:hypothetical protein HDF26_001729 [Pedobacter cryoconitis]|uniref:hypothetical protein n=1 Tax=Pedobacter cryoconitis TaxID=188932 RepID=UPI001615D2CA|nr:hypothetical protein [Pedobacter cryoconitis]MBB6271302.1 hypothetical protein [Pedobacter cryoconitis]
MDSREVFLDACNQINDGLAEFKFKAIKKGACLKKVAADNDLTFEIDFQSSSLNTGGYIKLLPHIQISSKKLKKWLQEHTDGQYSNDIVYGSQIGYISHFQEWKSWNVSGSNQEKTIAEIVSTIKIYVLPVFNLFEDTDKAISFLSTNGTKFNRYTAQSLTPLAFMLCFAPVEKTKDFFNNYLPDAPGKGMLLNFYKELEAGKKMISCTPNLLMHFLSS